MTLIKVDLLPSTKELHDHGEKDRCEEDAEKGYPDDPCEDRSTRHLIHLGAGAFGDYQRQLPQNKSKTTSSEWGAAEVWQLLLRPQTGPDRPTFVAGQTRSPAVALVTPCFHLLTRTLFRIEAKALADSEVKGLPKRAFSNCSYPPANVDR
jgi:hypothetical protein